MVKFLTAVLLILFAAFSRLIPHPANFTPVAAIALFSGVYLEKKYFFIIPVGAMLLSDLILGFHSIMIWVYGSFVVIALFGLWLKSHLSASRASKKTAYVIGTTLFSSVVFFIVTNFGMWTTGFYGYTFSGLAECYTMAIPFFRNTVAGDLFYVAVMFGIYELVMKYIKKPEFVKSIN
jgi:hypothetical protein